MDCYICEHKGFTWNVTLKGDSFPSLGRVHFSPDEIVTDWEREIFEDNLLEGKSVPEILDLISKEIQTDLDLDEHDLFPPKI